MIGSQSQHKFLFNGQKDKSMKQIVRVHYCLNDKLKYLLEHLFPHGRFIDVKNQH